MTEEVKEIETPEEEGSLLENLNRRDFIKGAAAAVGGIAFSSLAVTNFKAAAAEGQDYVIVNEVVKGGGGVVQGTGAPCELSSTFKKGETVVWHAVTFSGKTGEKINDHAEIQERGLKLQVELENGEKIDMHHGEHPPDETPKVYFWAGSWKISPGASTGKMTYSITAKDKEGGTGKLEMFGDKNVETFPRALTIEER
ncbi:twin-arginine translocation signal domain-containing protein [Candidatus Bipolaricaulota bacterium]|nr:twin-arginine translocation signal domain-containing protein [Candidatus Bipolaricaulota bacterium]